MSFVKLFSITIMVFISFFMLTYYILMLAAADYYL